MRKRKGEKERERVIPTTGGRPLKKVMRIYSDGRESRTYTEERRGESRESLARAAFVNDECVVARGGKL